MKVVKFIHICIQKFLIYLVMLYKKCLSPFLPGSCRFQPTCSEYMIDALKKYGVFKGLYLGIKRILRCHPWGGSGFDPVLDKESHKDKTNLL